MITFAVEDRDDRKLIRLEGYIFEDVEPQIEELLALKATIFDFDCAGIAGANSIGSTFWYRLIVNLSGKGQIVLRRCSVFFVDYANMTPQLVRGAKIASVYVPLECVSCDYETSVLLDASEFDREHLDAGNCPECRATVDPQTPLEDYLKIARKQALAQ